MNEVTARKYARTGSFEFDDAQLHRIAKNLVNLITGRFWNNLKIEYQKPVLIKSPITGQPQEIEINLRQVTDHKAFLQGAKATWSTNENLLTITVPDEFLWFQHTPDEWEQEYVLNLKHELTHAFDIAGNKAATMGNYPGAGLDHDEKAKFFKNPENKKKYFLDPAEVKAYLSQVTSEMQKIAMSDKSIKRPEVLLARSFTWKGIRKYYKDAPKVIRMFLTAAFHVLENATQQ